MTREHATDHEIYRKRGTTNMLLLALFLCIVFLIAIGTIFKMYEQVNARPSAQVEEAS